MEKSMSLTDAKIAVCNRALGYIGEHWIDANNTSSKPYEMCDRYYDDAIKEVLVEHAWNEAKTRSIVVQEADEPLFGYTYAFALPTDCLRVLRIGNGSMDTQDWEVEGGKILTLSAQRPLDYVVGQTYQAGQYITYSDYTYSVHTSFTASSWETDSAEYCTSTGGDYAVLQIEYIKNLTDTSMWSPKLLDAVCQRLAIKVAVGLSNNPRARYDLLEEFEKITMRKARSIDAQQGRVKSFLKSAWIRARGL